MSDLKFSLLSVLGLILSTAAFCLAQSSSTKTDADGTTPLHWAVFHDDLAEVERLLADDADVNVTNTYLVSPLSLASEFGHADIAKHLIAAGADVEAKRMSDETPLMLAARGGSVETVNALLSAEADVDAQDREGQTALMWAAAAGNADIVDALIDAGADVSYSLEQAGFTAFHFAARQGQSKVVKRILSAGFDVNEAMHPKSSAGRNPRDHMSALMLAVESAHFELALELVDAGADPNDVRSGYAPLHAVSWVRRAKLGDNPLGDPTPRGSGSVTSLAFVKEIIERGADVNLLAKTKKPKGPAAFNANGATPFLFAAQTGDLSLMKLLLELGADPKISNADGCTALIAAAGFGAVSVGEEPASEAEVCASIELLVELGLDVNAIDDNRETPMHGAAYRNYPQAVTLLASLGADPAKWNHKNKFGWTPFDIGHGHRPGSLKPSPPTLAALEQALHQTKSP